MLSGNKWGGVMDRKRIGEDARMVHVSYAMTDKNGTYSKYVGTSMCSLFKETTLMNHYQKKVDKSFDEKNYLFKNSWTDSDTCFNSGMLLRMPRY